MTSAYIIIGASSAGVNAAKAIRNIDKEGDIKLFSKEKSLPYFRPYLTELISDETIKEKHNFLVNKAEWYNENRIELLLEEPVIKIDKENKKVVSEKGEYPYDKLIIACGSIPFIPLNEDISLYKNVLAIKTVEDADKARTLAKKAKNVAIIGAGLLGLEAANSFIKLGLKVTMIEFADRLLPRQLDEESSNFFKAVIENENLEIKLNSSVKEIKSRCKKASALILNNGEEIKTDMVLFSVGVKADTTLAAASEISCDRFIKVNSKMETSEPDIYACGDVAQCNFFTPSLWIPAMKGGMTAGSNAAGTLKEMTEETYPAMMTSLGTQIFSAGDITNRENTESFTIKDENSGKILKFFFENNKIKGTILIGDTKLSQKLLMLLKKGASKEDVKELLDI